MDNKIYIATTRKGVWEQPIMLAGSQMLVRPHPHLFIRLPIIH